MISTHLECEPEHDNYRRLAEYIADAKHSGEKLLMNWCAECWAGDDYEMGIQEVQDTQSLNVRTKQEKTYHLLISFRPQDESWLTEDHFKRIEKDFAEALGFGEHQRHCGVHKNTNNLHMHVAYNMIHPERLTRHEPFRDFWIRDRLCRDIERRYGLERDNGREINKPKNERIGQKAARMESHTGQQSFEHYVKERHEPLMKALETASDWQDLHKAFATYGILIKPRGSGLALVDTGGKTAIKASTFDRAFSLKKLENVFGPYLAPGAEAKKVKPQEHYQARPLQRAPERGGLFVEYKAGIEFRKQHLAKIKEEEDARVQPLREKWEKKRKEICHMALPRRSKARLFKKSRSLEAEQLEQTRNEFQSRRQAVKQARPYSSWGEFLKWKAGEGDELALAILRSKKVEAAPETALSLDEAQAIREKIRAEFKQQESALRASDAFRDKTKATLLAVKKMERLAAEERDLGSSGAAPVFDGLKYRIDSSGVIIFTLTGGGTVRDTGRQIFFSGNNKMAAEAAKKYAAAKWGKNVLAYKNSIQLPEKKGIAQTRKSKGRGMGR